MIAAEYSALRAEISGRSRDQLVCVTASLLSVGALLSTVAADPVRFSALLVVVPWLLTVFGILWCDHAHAIHLLGTYIREHIENRAVPQYIGGSESSRLVGWESHVHAHRGKTKLLGYINVVLPLIYFALPSVVAVAAYVALRFRGATALPQALEFSFIGLSMALLIALWFSWRRAFPLT